MCNSLNVSLNVHEGAVSSMLAFMHFSSFDELMLSRTVCAISRTFETTGVVYFSSSLGPEWSWGAMCCAGESRKGMLVLFFCNSLSKGLDQSHLKGAWRDRDPNDFCWLLPYFLLSWLQIFQLFFVLLNFIVWFGSFLKIPSGKRKISKKPPKTP